MKRNVLLWQCSYPVWLFKYLDVFLYVWLHVLLSMLYLYDFFRADCTHLLVFAGVQGWSGSDIESSSDEEDSEPPGKNSHTATTTNGTSGTNGYLLTGLCHGWLITQNYKSQTKWTVHFLKYLINCKCSSFHNLSSRNKIRIIKAFWIVHCHMSCLWMKEELPFYM